MTEKEHEGVKITDKRRFSEDGKAREGVAGEKETPSGSGPQSVPAEDKKNEESKPLPDIDFPTFVLSLATSAQVHLGAIPNPQSGKEERDLTLAKQTIDILGILEAKTKGNLTGDEARLLEHVLYDLRMVYVEMKKK